MQFSDSSRFEGYLHAHWPLEAVGPNASRHASKEHGEVLVSVTASSVKSSVVPLWSFIV